MKQKRKRLLVPVEQPESSTQSFDSGNIFSQGCALLVIALIFLGCFSTVGWIYSNYETQSEPGIVVEKFITSGQYGTVIYHIDIATENHGIESFRVNALIYNRASVNETRVIVDYKISPIWGQIGKSIRIDEVN